MHNLFGPLFPVAVIAIMFSFGRGNSFRLIDFKWFLKAGGLFGHAMADSGYYNGGQKTWFWLTVLFGIAISVSGLILVFPNFGQGREVMAAPTSSTASSRSSSSPPPSGTSTSARWAWRAPRSP
jgi:formate dehydrogenase subunit gamma